MYEHSETMEAEGVRDMAASYVVAPVEFKPDAVPTGYKRTEVGVIPKDWTTERVGDFAILGRGRVISHNEIRKSITQRYPVYSSQTSQKGLMGSIDTYDFDGEYVTWTTDGVNAGSVFYRNGRFNCTNVCGTIKTRKGVDPKFLSLILNQHTFQYVSRNLANPKLMNGVMASIKLPLPSHTEQRAIANALSDIDALIESLDRLIAKKRAVKQGAMQQLLTGRKRLPGFELAWETKRLGDIAETVMGQSPSSSNYNSKGVGLPLIQGNADIKGRKTIKRFFTTQITKRGRAGDILMSVRAPVGEISRATFDVCLGRGVCALRALNDFFYHYLIYVEPRWAKHSSGSTFDSVNSTDIKAVEIEIPCDPDEQTAIAAVLSDMDAEIEVLEHRRGKAHQIKQGMMQQLLTGRVRLVKPEAQP
jgi:type I restriction enzyme S subunit